MSEKQPTMSLRRRSVVAPAQALSLTDQSSKDQCLAIKSISSDKWIWAFCLAFRVVNSLLVQTYFNPDEHWQALEVAHSITFGYGHLTWEWKKGIRSYLHPVVFALLYRVMGFLHLDTPWLMRKAPRVLQSVFASFADLYLYKLSRLIYDAHVARWTLFCQLVNWFMFYCITRTLVNSLETVLTVVGLFYWSSFASSPKNLPTGSRKLALFIASLACAIRPTSAISWLYVGFVDLWRERNRLKFVFLEVIPIGLLVLGLTSILDWWMYGSMVFVPLSFLKFNFFSAGGDYYGTHPWHWYFSQGYSVMLFTFLPFSLIGIFRSKDWRLSGLIAWVLGVYSILGHKEFRFVLPVLPLSLMFSGYSLAELSDSDSKRKNTKASSRCPSRAQVAILFLVATNVPMALYMSLVHQRGSEDAIYYLAKEASDGKVKSVLFLMPCHSTPYYSALHSNLPMRILDCSPSDNKGYLDESDQFMSNPVGFVLAMLENSSLPSHLVLFESEEKHLRELLVSHSFKEVKRFFHAHFKVDRDLQASVVIYTST
ncbi:putative hexosyltransferase [Dioscorea sansibarensis]